MARRSKENYRQPEENSVAAETSIRKFERLSKIKTRLKIRTGRARCSVQLAMPQDCQCPCHPKTYNAWGDRALPLCAQSATKEGAHVNFLSPRSKATSKKGGRPRKGTKKVSVQLFNRGGMLSYFIIADNVIELRSCYWHLTALSSQGTQRANRVICKLGDADYQRQLRLYCGLNSDITNVCNGCRSNFESHVRGLGAGAGACSNQGRAAVA